MSDDQEKYGNEWERTVLGTGDIDPVKYAREIARYRFARPYIRPGMRVLELGCSSGFGTRFLPEGIQYTGLDYGQDIIEYARANFMSESRRFICATIDEFLAGIDERFDVIIAFEVLEHTPNGREVAQALKRHCQTLLVSTPHREPPGYWGKHHVLHGLKAYDFPQFDIRYMHMDATISDRPKLGAQNLMLMTWESGKAYADRPSVLCSIPTKNRYDALLHCLQSIAFQTVKPDKVIVYDDGEHQDLREHPIGRYIFPLLDRHGLDWEVVFMPGCGQHLAHQAANTAGYDLVWRMDDDGVAEPDVLERLLAHMQPGVGAVGGAVYEMDRQVRDGTSRIVDFFDRGNVQWAPDHGVFDVDFLYSSFLYRAGVVNYKPDMSPVAFHEETIFTHRLKRAGYRLIADTSIHTHHFKSPHGGCRDKDYKAAYDWDNDQFMRILADEFGVKLIHLGGGLGDCLAFKNILPELQRRYETVVVGAVFPEAFEGTGVKIIPYDKAEACSKDNVYAWMTERNWKGSMIDAYRGMYL